MIFLRNLRLKPFQCFFYKIRSVLQFESLPYLYTRKNASLINNTVATNYLLHLTCKICVLLIAMSFHYSTIILARRRSWAVFCRSHLKLPKSLFEPDAHLNKDTFEFSAPGIQGCHEKSSSRTSN